MATGKRIVLDVNKRDIKKIPHDLIRIIGLLFSDQLRQMATYEC